ncbi:uncharacterized protein [Antedon mediterranea]|uniref:uncharacterized protein n=1 Tax=Antedon mediterranea TaxID=105859 RepID=UPI003AF7A586
MFTLWSIFSALYLYSLVSEAVTTIKPLNLEVFAGKNAAFQCNTDQNGTALWQWFKNRRNPVATENGYVSEGYSMTVSIGTSELTKYNTTIEDDQTQYHCQYISSSLYAYLTVITRLDAIYPLCETNTTSVNSDKTVSISCSAQRGNTRPELQWYRNGVKLTERVDFFNGKLFIDELIRALTYDDEGAVFLCKAEGSAVGENQSCQVKLNTRPDVIITYANKSFTAGDSLEFTCTAMSPWKIISYVWTINNELVTASGHSFSLKDNMTTLVVSDLQSSDDDAEIKCEAMTKSGLTSTDSVTILFNDIPITTDSESVFPIFILYIGGVLLLILISIVIVILVKRRKKQGKTSITKTERVRFQNSTHSKDGIVNIISLDNPTFTYDPESVNEINEDFNNPHVVKIRLNDYDIGDNGTDEFRSYEEQGFETYANAESAASIGSFCSFNSFDQDDGDFRPVYDDVGSQPSIDIGLDMQESQMNRHTNTLVETISVDDLYAKPIKKRRVKGDTRSLDGIDNVEEQYAKPIKKNKSNLLHRQSIHQSLENVLRPNIKNDTFYSTVESFDDLYAKPNKTRVTGQPKEFKSKQSLKPKLPPKPTHIDGRSTIRKKLDPEASDKPKPPTKPSPINGRSSVREDSDQKQRTKPKLPPKPRSTNSDHKTLSNVPSGNQLMLTSLPSMDFTYSSIA